MQDVCPECGEYVEEQPCPDCKGAGQRYNPTLQGVMRCQFCEGEGTVWFCEQDGYWDAPAGEPMNKKVRKAWESLGRPGNRRA